MQKKLWFRAKTYGWGWTPCSWEGWLTLVLFSVYMIWNFFRIDRASHSGSVTLSDLIPEIVSAVILLIAICYARGEKPSWRWGKKK